MSGTLDPCQYTNVKKNVQGLKLIKPNSSFSYQGLLFPAALMDNLAAAPLDVDVTDAVDLNVEHGGYVTAKRILPDCNETEQDKGRMKIIKIVDDDEHSDQIKSLKCKYDTMLRNQKNKFDADRDALKREVQTLANDQLEELRELDSQHDENFRRLQEQHNLKRAAIRTHHVRSITEVQTAVRASHSSYLGMAATSFRQQITNTIESDPLEQLRERIHDAEAESTSYRSAADQCIRTLQTSVAFMEGGVAKLSSDLDMIWQEINNHYQQDSEFVVADNARGLDGPSLHDSVTPDDAESADSWFSAQE
ncbi:hypothetical protein ARMGADRAFT_1033799 [Armillaria gallica]|uniref:Uncharacterized protein n=1 Tax=Armillaria gallica TaxID=47427 RepID=A0A2H3DBN0_ARMGA|nr:hypothetical protein ARMGADRAFT_1033799 [Armillaria gallica]